jgi:nicotinamide riboside kinase
MLYCFMGASCTGKSSAAESAAKKTGAKVYTGKDYLKLAKNAADAQKVYKELLEQSVLGEANVIAVISETEDLALVPKGAFKVLFVTEPDIMKQRFSQRMNGHLPPAVETMLERKAAAWGGQSFDMKIESHLHEPDEIADIILEY